MTGPFKIREVASLEEFIAIEEIQREAWGFADKEIVPESILVAIQKAGGLVLGAFSPAGRMEGFVFSVPGLKEGRAFHHSHMAAVRPPLQGSGIALALKREQRKRVLEMGLDRILWTFDPIEARNGSFNFRKLGVVAHRYIENLYGLSSGFIHGGLPTDRVEVVWDLNSERTLERAGGDPPPSTPPPEGLPRLNRTERDPSGRRAPVSWGWEGSSPAVLIEIPADIRALKETARPIARRWRMHIREGLGALLGEGYRIEGFHLLRGEDPRPFYLLRKGRPEKAPK